MNRAAGVLAGLLLLASCASMSRRADGDPASMLLVTGDFDAFLREWHELPAADAPAVPSVHEAFAGDSVTAFVLFRGCTPGADGHCIVDVDYDVVRPDGTAYGPHSTGPLWTSASPGAGAMQLGQARLTLFFELGDALGEYVIHARVTDRVTGRSVLLEQSVRVSPRPGSFAA